MPARQTLQEMTDRKLIETAEKLLADGGTTTAYVRLLKELVVRLRRLQ